MKSPPGRNVSNNFSTIGPNMQSMEMTSPMASMNNKNYMMYPHNDMSTTFSDMKQYSNNSGMPQYVMSMSTNINLGIIDDNMRQQNMRMKPNMNSISLKKNIATRGNFRKNRRLKSKNMGYKDYMQRFQENNQSYQTINRDKVTDSINNMGLFSGAAKNEPEQFEYKALDSQIGSLMKRDYTVDRSHMRNQQNLASLVVSQGKVDSTISPNPRGPRLNDSLMFKSTNAPSNMMGGMMFNNHNTINSLADARNIISPSKDNRNVKLEPIDHSYSGKQKSKKASGISSPTDVEESKSPKIKQHSKVVRQETEYGRNLLDNVQESTVDMKGLNQAKKRSFKSPDSGSSKISNEKRLSSKAKTDDENQDGTPNPIRDQTPSQMTSQSPQLEEQAKEEEVKKEEQKPFKIAFPMSHNDMLTHLSKYLTDYEKREVVKYDIIYFNILERKLRQGPVVPEGKQNNGYDNEQGEYMYVDHDHIKYRFEIVRKLGKGSFGVVLKCYDHLKKEN